MKKYFIYNNQYLSGGRYWLRMFLQAFLIYFIIGFYLWGVTSYARAKSLQHSNGTALALAILNPISLIFLFILNTLYRSSYNVSNFYFLFVLLSSGLHLYLWFSNGTKPKKIVVDNESQRAIYETKLNIQNSEEKKQKTIFENELDSFDENITKAKEVIKTQNKKGETEKIFYDNGNLKEEFQVNTDGEKHGFCKLYHINEQLKVQVYYTNGVQDDGEIISYHEDGSKAREVTLVNDKFNGEFFEWHKNGNLKKQGEFVDGKTTVLKEWDEKGLLNEVEITKKNSASKDKALNEGIEKYNYYHKGGNLKLKIFIEKHANKNDKVAFPGLLLCSIQKHEEEECFLPNGIWEGYRENGTLEFEVDFNTLRPESFYSKERTRTIDFDYSACELRKYDDKEKLISREYKSLKELKSTYLLKDTAVEIENCTAYKLLENIIEFGDFILPNIQRCTGEEIRSKFEVITEQKNWIQGFSMLYNRPEEGALSQYVPFYFEDGEESFNHPNSGMPISFMKSHVEIATFCEQDALKIINEIMIFNGGVKSFKDYSTEEDFLDIVFRNQLIRINKGIPKAIDFPVSGTTIEAEMVYVGIDLLPPKNIVGQFTDANGRRGVHPVSKYINNLLLGLNTPVFCFLDGGIADGRLYVIRDDTTRIILSIDSDFDSTNFRNIIKCFSNSNLILDMDDEKMQKLLDLSDLLSKENQLGTYSPNINFKKEDSVLSFIIGDKLLVSLLKQSGYYQMRIDKVTDEDWQEIILDENEHLEFYITKTDVSSIDSNFDIEVKKLFEAFDKRVSDVKYDDLPYWYNIIKGRATSNISQLDREKPLNQTIGELIFSHADEYRNRLDGAGGDIYNMGAEYEDDDKISFIKMRIVAFGAVFKYLSELQVEINLLVESYKISIDPTKEKMDLELAHAKASVYGAIKYALDIGIKASEIKEWFPDFENNSKFIEGINPFEALAKKHNIAYDNLIPQHKMSANEQQLIPDWFKGDVCKEGTIEIDNEGNEVQLSPIEKTIYELTKTYHILLSNMREKEELKEEIFKSELFQNMENEMKLGKSWLLSNNLKAHNIIFGEEPVEENLKVSRPVLKQIFELIIERSGIEEDILKEKDLSIQESLWIEAIEKDSEHSECYNLLAYNQYKQNKYNEGISYIKVALKQSPENSNYLDTLAVGYYYNNQLDLALIEINKCIEIDTSEDTLNAEHLCNRGKIYYKLNDINRAITDLEKSISIDNDYEESKHLLDEIITNRSSTNFNSSIDDDWS